MLRSIVEKYRDDIQQRFKKALVENKSEACFWFYLEVPHEYNERWLQQIAIDASATDTHLYYKVSRRPEPGVTQECFFVQILLRPSPQLNNPPARCYCGGKDCSTLSLFGNGHQGDCIRKQQPTSMFGISSQPCLFGSSQQTSLFGSSSSSGGGGANEVKPYIGSVFGASTTVKDDLL